ncbi:MAG: hypothetical protein RR190_01605 [Bacteroidales bacterium]
MKRFFILIVFFIEVLSVSAGNDSTLKDSIIAQINAIENDSARLEFEVLQQYKYMRSPFARTLMDKLYEDAQKMGDRKKEMIALCGYFNIAYTTLNIEEIEKTLPKIKSHAEKYNLYDYFYRCKKSYFALMASNGNMEWVLLEATKMQKEAQKLNHKTGIICAKIAIAQAYKYTRNDRMVIQTLQEILNIEGLENKEKTGIYLDLYTSLQNLKRYKEGLKYLDLQNKLLKEMLQQEPKIKAYLESRMMHNETLYADAYMALGNYAKAEEHLKKCDLYYKPTVFISYYVLYHSTYARYYAHLKKWDLCFQNMDCAINRLGTEQALLKQSLLAKKSKYLEEAGKLQETVRSYQELLSNTDSINKVFIQKQEEALSANYKLERSLEKKAQYTYILSLLSIIFCIVFILIIIGFIVQKYRTHIQLQKSKNEAEKAKKEAIESNRLRTKLLENISKEIETPIHKIQKLAEQIVVDSTPILDSSLIQNIKNEATNLIQILELVVDFSKLEVGAIQFDICKTDILNLCYRATDLAQKQPGNKTEIYFIPQIEIQPIPLDCNWMLRCLISAMTDLTESLIPNKLHFTIKYDQDGKMVIFEMIGSPLANPLFAGQLQTLKNHINTSLIQSFGGAYKVETSELHPVLLISLPIYFM